MRALIVVSIAGAVCSTTLAAGADAYAFGGSSRRVEVDISLLGFHDGAGVGGWDLDSARELATWAKRMDVLLPEDATVSLERAIDDDTTTLTLYGPTMRLTFALDATPGYDEATTLLAHRLGRPIPSVTPATLYTIQMMATHSRAGAERFALALDERGVHAIDSFYVEACLPCSIPEAHVLGPDAAGWHRVVIGIFDRPASAQRSLADLQRRTMRRAFVRAL